MARAGLTKDPSERAAAAAVERAQELLRKQWSAEKYPKCAHHTWEDLANAVGLSISKRQIGALKQWVHRNKLPEPRRPMG
jgi:hypothetical protein